ncbi:MAG: NAD(P)H-dependent flavin oxidoreductase [Acidimicrobiales bacterium]
MRSLWRRPIVVAPMGGGPSTVGLVVAATENGALAFLAGAYKSVEAIVTEIGAVRRATPEPFGVNVFVPGSPSVDADRVADYLMSLDGDARTLGTSLGDPCWDDDHWGAKIEALLAAAPPIVSFTFGCPEREVVQAFHAKGVLAAVTVTDAEEARIAEASGADCLCVQGVEAGAHRGHFTNKLRTGTGLGVRELVREIARGTELPLIAAGGISRAEDVAAVLRAGAVAAQCGTAFLRSAESGAHPAHKDALVDPRFSETALTRSFSGRPARGLVNRFVLEHPDAPAAYPEINNATRPLRAAAAAAGDTDRMSLWAGTGFRQATSRFAGEIIDDLAAAPLTRC